MQPTDKAPIRADKGLLLVLLLIYAAINTVILLVLSLVLSGRAMLFAVLAASVLYAAFTVYLVLYFLTVKYEKESEFIKITSGIFVRKFTYICTNPLPFVSSYRLPFGVGFSVIRIYGGTQVIFSKKVI